MADLENRAYDLFAKALIWPEGERAARLDAACGEDIRLKERVVALLAGVGKPGAFDGLIARIDPPAPPAPRMDARTPFIDKYEIRNALGSGGMGVVYRAFDTRLRREVALKFLREDLTADPEAKARLLVEAQAVASLEHPNICTIYEVGETAEGQLYLAMPCYEGETLRAKVERGPLPLLEATGYVRQVAAGLQRAHAAGIVHRDIKPANVLVTPDGIVKILDFGVARRAGSQLTSAGAQVGTMAYMSPEQLRGERVDHRADIWALGVVLFELLTGRRPFQGEYHYALMYALLNEEPISLRSLRPDAAPALESLITRALHKEITARWSDVAAFSAALDAAAAPPPAQVSVHNTDKASPTRRQLSVEGERRQATVLVVALPGYAEMAEELLPSQLQQRIDALVIEVQKIAAEEEGVCYRFSGEEAIVLFGVPEGHEDDGLRGVRAARAIHRAAAGFGPQSAIASGTLIARNTPDGESDFEVTGKILSLARRMASQAEEDTTLADGASARLVRSHYDLVERGTVTVGRGETEPVYRIAGERSHAAQLKNELRLTAFTGRQREYQTIVRSFERVCGGEGHFVTINGEAGLGKSRLLYEFRESLDLDEAGLLIGRCQSHASRTPYLPFLDVLRMAFGIDTLRAADVVPEQVVASIRAIGEDLESLIPIYLRLLGLEHPDFPVPAFLEGEQLHRAVMESLAALMTTLAGRRPLVVLLEDWHWADEGSRNTIAHIVDILASHRILVLVTYRPSFTPDWGQPESLVPIRLRPLEATEIVSMIASMLGVVEVPDRVSNVLMDRTEGNPFFLEELLTTLLEQQVISVQEGRLHVSGEIDDTSVPATVQAVLQDRIARLPEEARTLLLAASVVGRSFTLPLLQRIAPDLDRLDAQLDIIRKTGLIQQTRVLPEVEYRFKHALVQDVAYDSLLAHQRKRLHGAVGDAIEALYPERADEQPFVLARHFAEAERWEPAVRYAKLASEQAWQLVRYNETQAINQALLTWLDAAPDTEIIRRLRLEALFVNETIFEGLHLMNERRDCLAAIESILELENDPLLECEWLRRKGDFLVETLDYEGAWKALDRAIALAEIEHDDRLLGRSLRSMGWWYVQMGNNELALQVNQRALELAEHTHTHEETIGILINLTFVATKIGDHDGARAYLEMALGRSTWKSSFHYSSLMYLRARLEHATGDTESAVASFEESMEHFNAMMIDGKNRTLKGTFVRLPIVYLSLAEMMRQAGRTSEAERWYLMEIEFHRNPYLGRQDDLAMVLMVTGNFYMQQGRNRESSKLLEEAHAIYERLSVPHGLLSVCTSLAILYERIENFPGAIVHWERVDELSAYLGDGHKRYLALEGKARLARVQGREAEVVRDLYKAALDCATQGGFEAECGQLLNTMGIIEWGQENYESALGFFQEGYHLYSQKADAVHAGLMLNAVASTLIKLGRLEDARDVLTDALGLHTQTGERTLKAHALAMLGDVQRDLGAYDDALETYGQSLEFRWVLEDRAGEGWMLERIAQIHTLRGEPELARKSAGKAMEIAQEIGERRLAESCLTHLP